MRKGNRSSEAGFHIVAKTLAVSKIRNGKLVHGATFLTAERLRELISHAALDAGAMAQHTIAAPGGVGLEIHEELIIRSKAPYKLRKGMVVTVEPGLYYEGLGGCRIEDRNRLRLHAGRLVAGGSPR